MARAHRQPPRGSAGYAGSLTKSGSLKSGFSGYPGAAVDEESVAEFAPAVDADAAASSDAFHARGRVCYGVSPQRDGTAQRALFVAFQAGGKGPTGDLRYIAKYRGVSNPAIKRCRMLRGPLVEAVVG